MGENPSKKFSQNSNWELGGQAPLSLELIIGLMSNLGEQVGATEGSAHGGASPSVNSAGSGCLPGPKARVPPGRRLRHL